MIRKHWWEKGWIEPSDEKKIRYLEKMMGKQIAVKCEKCDKYYTDYAKEIERRKYKYCLPCLNKEVMSRLHGKKPKRDKGKFFG